MPSLAEDLRAARERLGLSVQDIAIRTRISRTFLEAIEKGDYKNMPGEVFIVGFHRTYAKLVGLDDDEVIRRYKLETGGAQPAAEGDEDDSSTSGPPEPKAGPASGKAREDKSDNTNLMRFLGVILVLILIAVVYLIFSGEESAPLKIEPPAEQTEQEPVLSQLPETSEEPPLPNITSVVPEYADPVPTQPVSPVELTIKVTAESWLAYETDASGYKDMGILKPGDEVSIQAEQEILIDTGNAGGLDVTYNGRALGPMGQSGAVYRNILYTADKAGARGKPRTPRPVYKDNKPISTPSPQGTPERSPVNEH